MFQGLSLFTYEFKKISFEDIQHIIKKSQNIILINTLQIHEQECLIKTTISYQAEEQIVNDLIKQYKFKEKKFVVYGKNTNDESAEKKCKQLISIGFSDVFLYSGGLFEWLLLQDIYGPDEFPTTTKILDILKFRANQNLFIPLNILHR